MKSAFTRHEAAFQHSRSGNRADEHHTFNGINPQAYLTWVLDTIADHPVDRIDELLPWNFSVRLP